jgi:RHS repeat-associated protein
LGYVTRSSYDAEENLSDMNDAEGNNTHYDYDERGFLWKVVDADGGITEYSYTANSKLDRIEDAKGNETLYEYDGFGRLVCITYPDDTNETFVYDKNSNLTGFKNRSGETISYQYDALNRMVVKDSPCDAYVTYTYDIASRLIDVNYSGKAFSYNYDRIGRLVETVDSENRTLGYDYDERGLRTELVYPDDTDVTYSYDELGRLTEVRYQGDTIAQYEYDELSRRTLLTLGNDANTVYEYDMASRLTKLTNNIDVSNSITFEYASYDKVGNRLSMKVADANAHVYEYDNLYRLIFVDYNDVNTTATSYGYDMLGNRTDVNESGTTTDYNSNILNQYTSVGGTSFSYDDNGNLINDGLYKYYYDCENRLTDVNDANDSPIASYEYDYLGRRIKKIIYGLLGVVTKYCYSGDQVIAEYEDDILVRKFIYGPGIDEPICMIAVNGGETKYYYHFDGLGSVVALSDSGADVVEKYSYDVYGEPNTISGIGNPYMFTGRRFDDETELYYYRARYYNPEIGRFLQTDPVGYDDGMNLYTYVSNNPFNWVDPFGLCKEDSKNLWEKWYDYWYNIGYNWDDWDAITISLSGSIFAPSTGGVGTGIEAVYIFEHGWVIYWQVGGGMGAPGGGASLEIGQIFNLQEPEDYTGAFIEGQAGYAPSGVGLSGSVFYSPKPGIFHPGEGPWGYKGGIYAGTPVSAGVLVENYEIIYDFKEE